MYFVFKNIRTFVAEFQHNKILSIEFDMLYLNLDVVARNSRWEIQYCLVQVLKHLGYKIWNVMDPISLVVHFIFFRTTAYDHHMSAFDFFNQLTNEM